MFGIVNRLVFGTGDMTGTMGSMLIPILLDSISRYTHYSAVLRKISIRSVLKIHYWYTAGEERGGGVPNLLFDDDVRYGVDIYISIRGLRTLI